MNVKTLDELKAENQLSDDSKKEQPPVEPEETEEAEPEETESEEAEPESWLSADDPENEERTVPLLDHISIRQKLKSRLRDQKSEIEQLREELRAVKQPQSADQPVKRPRRQDFRDLDDPDEAYDEAYERYEKWLRDDMESRAMKRVQREQQEQQELAQRRALERSVESHYDRAARLVAENKVSADQYQAADSAVLHTIQNVYGDKAELIRDSFIDRLGPGSEKVLYQVGNNAAVRRQFGQKLSEDRTGIAAAIFLGQLQTRVAAPMKKVSQAPKPSKPLPGGTPPGSTSDLYKRYTKAADLQSRIDIRLAAWRQGVDTSKW